MSEVIVAALEEQPIAIRFPLLDGGATTAQPAN